MRDLIFVSMEDWDDVWRRNQFFCAGLARRHPELKILFVGTQRNVLRHLRAGKISPLVRNPVWVVPGYPNITVTRPLRVGLETYAWGRSINQRLIRSHVRALAKRLGLGRPILWLNPHYAVHMVSHMDESAIVYDITDDWTSMGDQPDSVAEQIREQDQQLCRLADATIVCSKRLYDLKRPLTDNLHLIPNGVDADHYAGVLDGNGRGPELAANWARPVLGYIGTVHPERIDLSLLEQVARRLTVGSIVLVGPNHLSELEQRRLTVTGRVVFVDAVPYAQVPQYMRAFDVCITPHRVTAFTESLNPIKLWEYLAAGKPIVATPVAGFRDYPHLVHLASDADEFLRAALAALEEDHSMAEARRREARQHSWEGRIDAVESVLRRFSDDMRAESRGSGPAPHIRVAGG